MKRRGSWIGCRDPYSKLRWWLHDSRHEVAHGGGNAPLSNFEVPYHQLHPGEALNARGELGRHSQACCRDPFWQCNTRSGVLRSSSLRRWHRQRKLASRWGLPCPGLARLPSDEWRGWGVCDAWGRLYLHQRFMVEEIRRHGHEFVGSLLYRRRHEDDAGQTCPPGGNTR
jgi:hypothetical protein